MDESIVSLAPNQEISTNATRPTASLAPVEGAAAPTGGNSTCSELWMKAPGLVVGTGYDMSTAVELKALDAAPGLLTTGSKSMIRTAGLAALKNEMAADSKAEQSGEGVAIANSVHQTPQTLGPDSGYNSPEDEIKAWEKVLQMKEKEHEDDISALKDEHEDEVKELRSQIDSVTRTKELLQKRVKKEVLAKQDHQRQLTTLEGEHDVALTTIDSQKQEIGEQEEEIVVLRARVKQMEKGKERETRWEAWYHNAVTEAQQLRTALELCTKQKAEAMEFAEAFQSELRLTTKAKDRFQKEVAAKQSQIEVDERYHEQIRGQNLDLQNRINQSIVDMANLKKQMAKADRAAAAEVKRLTAKLDNQTAALYALEDMKDDWKADAEDVLHMLSARVTTDQLVTKLADHMKLLLREQEMMAERVQREIQEADALSRQLVTMNSEREQLSQVLGEKEEEITSLKKEIGDLETDKIRREMNDAADERAEPGYLRALEEVATLRQQLHQQTLNNAAVIATTADRGARKAIRDLEHINNLFAADYAHLQEVLAKERQERHMDGYARAAHEYNLETPSYALEEYKQRAINAERVWDRVHELEKQIEDDRIARLKSDAVTLEIRADLEAAVAEKEALIGRILDGERGVMVSSSNIGQTGEDPAGDNAGEGPTAGNLFEPDGLPAVDESESEDDQMSVEFQIRQLEIYVDRMYQRMTRLEAMLAAAGRAGVGSEYEGRALRAEIRRFRGYNSAESQSDEGEVVATGEDAEAANESLIEGEEVSEDGEAASGDNEPGDGPADAADQDNQNASSTKPIKEAKSGLDTATKNKLRRFVLRALREGASNHRVFGEPTTSSPAPVQTPSFTPPPGASTLSEDERHDSSSPLPSSESEEGADFSSKEGDDGLQPYHPPPMPAKSLAWIQKHRPFVHGEPVNDDQFWL